MFFHKWYKIEDYVNKENFPCFSTMVFIITTVALGRRTAAAAVAACAHSLSHTHTVLQGWRTCAAAAAHIKRGVRLPPLGWLASLIINAMRAGDLDFEKLSSNTGVA
jgi:hypothetical protein